MNDRDRTALLDQVDVVRRQRDFARTQLTRVRAERNRLFVALIELRASVTDRPPSREMPVTLALMRATDLDALAPDIAVALAKHDAEQSSGTPPPSAG